MDPAGGPSALPDVVPALLPRGSPGYQFVCYGDACSGVPGTPHEATFAAVNAVVARLRPRPELILFPGDEVIGLTADDDALRAQWRHFLDHEMAWLDREAIPVYHTTGNHTTYDAGSEAVFREVLAHLPRNGPPGQEGLSYFVRRGDLLPVFVNTFWSGLGGEGRVETAWLDRVLAEHADARHKLVLGHHPVHPVNVVLGRLRAGGRARGRRDALADAGAPRRARLRVQPHPGVRRAGPRRRPAGPDRRGRHGAPDAGGPKASGVLRRARP